MRVRIEVVGEQAPEEVVIFCRKLTPEVEEISRRLSQVQPVTPIMSFYKGDEQYYLSIKEILFFETEGEGVFAHTLKDSYEIKQRLYELETILPRYFVRISRSTIVSTLQIFSIQKGLTRVGQVSFRGTHKEVYVSRMYSKMLKERMEERHLYEKV